MNTSTNGGPPKDVSPGDLFRRLSERPRPTKAFTLPRLDGFEFNVVLRVLTENELHFCRANAQKASKEFLGGEQKVGDLGYEEIYQNDVIVQLVCIACRDAEDPKFPAFPSAKAARLVLTTDEFAVLAAAYNEFRRESGPILSEITPSEMESWIRVLKEGASRVPLARLSGEAKSDLILALMEKLSIATGSAGSPRDGSFSASPVTDDESTTGPEPGPGG